MKVHIRTRGALRGRLLGLVAFVSLAASCPALRAQPLSSRPVEGFPSPDVFPSKVLLDGPTLYAVGRFRSAGTPTPNFRFLDPVTAQPVGRVPSIERDVRRCVPDGSGGFYVGGAMIVSQWGDVYGGLFRFDAAGERLACVQVSASTGAGVFDMATASGSMFVGGRFEAAGRQNLIAINPETGQPRPWNLSTNGDVWGIAAVGDRAFVCGSFTTIGGQSRQGVACLRTADGVVLPWTSPITVGPNAFPSSISALGEHLFLGGNEIQTPGGGRKLVRLAAADGSIQPWDAQVNSGVSRVMATPASVYVLGAFSASGGVERNGCAAFDPATGALQAWNPSISGTRAESIAPGPGNIVFLSGGFTSIGGQRRAQVAAVHSVTGAVLPWNANGNEGNVSSTSVNWLGDRVAVLTTSVIRNGTPRECLMAVDVPSRTLLPLAPQFRRGGAEASVNLLAKADDRLIVAGAFTTVDGIPTAGFGEIRLSTGQWTSLDSVAGIGVTYTFAAHGDMLYVMGDRGSLSTYSLAAVHLPTRTLRWSTPINGGVEEIVVSEDGSLVVANNVGAGFVRCFSAETGVQRWSVPDPSRNVRHLAIHCDKLLIGTGGSISANGRTSQRLAVVSLADGRLIAPSTSFLPVGGGGDFTVAGIGPAALISGGFELANGVPVPRVAAIDLRFPSRTMDWRPQGISAQNLVSSSAGVVASHIVPLVVGGVWCPTIAVFEATCQVDINTDGFIDCFDYIDFVTCFEGLAVDPCPDGKSADFNDDGFVDFFDYAAFVAAFEDGC